MLAYSFSQAQVTVFTENFGTTAWYDGSAQGYGGYSNPQNMFSTDPIRLQDWSNSAGAYDGASGAGRVQVGLIGADDRSVFTISGINTSSYINCHISFGSMVFYGNAGQYLQISISTDGTNWTAIDPAALSEGTYSAANSWSKVTLSGAIPSTVNLRIRIRNPNTAQTVLMDDISVTGTFPDSDPPTQPLNLASNNVTSSSFVLSWTASTDNNSISRYDVLQDGNVVGSTTGVSLLLKYLQAGTSSNYTVIAYDIASNPSTPSAALTVNLPSVPVGFKYDWEKTNTIVDNKGDLAWAPVAFAYSPGATIRYIDFEGGNDASAGTSTSTAWKHHPWDAAATGNAQASSGKITYVFKKGVIYRGKLTADESGSYGNPIILTSDPAWGSGEACIYGSTRITSGWNLANSTVAPNIPNQGLVYYKNIPGFNDTKMVCEIDGSTKKRIHLARTPNYYNTPEEPQKKWWAFTKKQSVSGSLNLTDTKNLLQTDVNFYKGGDCWATEDAIVMCSLWKQKVDNYNPATNTITVSDPNFGGVQCRYFIENTPYMLDTTSEYYYDNASGNLFIRLEGDKNPNTTIIEIANNSNSTLLDINSKTDIVVSGISFGFTSYNSVRFGQNDGHATIALSNKCSNIEIKNCKFEYVNAGIIANGSSDQNVPMKEITISDNEMNHLGDFGVFTNENNGVYVDEVRILRNKIFDVGMRHLGRWYSSIPCIAGAIVCGEISGNIIEQVWGSGTNINWGKASGNSKTIPFIRGFVHHNKVAHSLLGTNDYGGIESWMGGPTYTYSNIAEDAQGYKYNWGSSLGYPIYFDGTFKYSAFNNIIFGNGWNKNGSAFAQVLGFYNITANNTVYNVSAFSSSGGENLALDGYNTYLSNISDSTGKQISHSTRASGVPFDSYLNNIFAASDFYGNFLDGRAASDFSTFCYDLNTFKPMVGQVGYQTLKSSLADPAKGDFRPALDGAAIDKGVNYFLPFPLSSVVGEWHFYKHQADSSLIRSDNFYATSEYTTREQYNSVPKAHLKAYSLNANSFVVGDLEDWIQGALEFNGTSTYCALANSVSSAKVCNNVDMTTNNFIIETYLKTQNGIVDGVIVCKYGASNKGYQIDIDNGGHARVSLMNAGVIGFSRSSAAVINDANWHHILAEVNRKGTINIFIDGQLSNGGTTGTPLASNVSLTNSFDLLVGKCVTGKFFKGTIDFLRISKGLLMDARTTIHELYKWQTDGPFKYDFAGNPPLGKRDAGALENGVKTCDMALDVNSLSFSSSGELKNINVTGTSSFNIDTVMNEAVFTNTQNTNSIAITALENLNFESRSGQIWVTACNETKIVSLFQEGSPCALVTDVADTVFFEREGGKYRAVLTTNAKTTISKTGSTLQSVYRNTAKDSIVISAPYNNKGKDQIANVKINSCETKEFVIIQLAFPVGIDKINSGKIFVYPNPAKNNTLFVDIDAEDQNLVLSVCDLAGKVLDVRNCTSGKNIMHLNCSKGLYILKISGTNTNFMTKIFMD